YYTTSRNATSSRPSPLLFRRRHLGGRLVEHDSDLVTESREGEVIRRQPPSNALTRNETKGGNVTSGLYKVLRVVPETGKADHSHVCIPTTCCMCSGHQLSFLDQL